MGFQANLQPDINGDIRIRFPNSEAFGRFLSESVRLLSGDEIIRIGGGCLAILNRQAAILLCDRAE